jgi:hypothetical protein
MILIPEKLSRASERERDATRKREVRASARDIEIPDCKNPQRREKAEVDPLLWLATYGPKFYRKPLSRQLVKIAEDYEDLSLYGGCQATAASRGEGKTTIIQYLSVRAQLKGLLDYILLIAQSGPKAEQILKNIKAIIERNEHLDGVDHTLLADDYPEVVVPIRSLKGAAQAGGTQTVGGERTFLQWSANQFVLPRSAMSKCSGFITMALGLDSGSLRGLNDLGKRPKMIVIDDPETFESARSETQIAAREQLIEADLAGSEGQAGAFGMFMTTTIQTPNCVSAKYTDPKQMPAWCGKRYRFVESWPTDAKRWDEYVKLRRDDMQKGDRFARRAHQHYLEHRSEMDDGVIVCNPTRFKSESLKDGTQNEASAIQHVYNLIADKGADGLKFVLTEWQNEPPPVEDGSEDCGITADLVASRINGLDQGQCEERIEVVGCHVDIHNSFLQFCVVGKAKSEEGWGSVIDYGTVPTGYVYVKGADERSARLARDVAIEKALRELLDDLETKDYADTQGRARPITAGLVDVGYCDHIVWNVIGHRPLWTGCKGIGDGAYRHVVKDSTTRRAVGLHAYESKQGNREWQLNMDTDHWVRHVHEMLLADPFDEKRVRCNGSLALFGRDPEQHLTTDFAPQIVAWLWTTKFKKGKGLVTGLHNVYREDHALDTTYGAIVACELATQRRTRRANRSTVTTAQAWFGEAAV